jgi:O-acetyl-ADP-ribose deacetylase (regulator of RNase III)
MGLAEVTGDLFDLGFPALGHGCNTRGLMGTGIAVEFKYRFPGLYSRYVRECHAGNFTLGDVLVWDVGDVVVYNLATQPRPGPSADLDAIQTSISAALADAARRELHRFGIPRIGAGLGGLPWKAVRERLEIAASEHSVELVVVTLSEGPPGR